MVAVGGVNRSQNSRLSMHKYGPQVKSVAVFQPWFWRAAPENSPKPKPP
jgi:hypothetical protein